MGLLYDLAPSVKQAQCHVGPFGFRERQQIVVGRLASECIDVCKRLPHGDWLKPSRVLGLQACPHVSDMIDP